MGSVMVCNILFVSPFNARTSTHDTTLPGVPDTGGRPVFVPKGTK